MAGGLHLLSENGAARDMQAEDQRPRSNDCNAEVGGEIAQSGAQVTTLNASIRKKCV